MEKNRFHFYETRVSTSVFSAPNIFLKKTRVLNTYRCSKKFTHVGLFQQRFLSFSLPAGSVRIVSLKLVVDSVQLLAPPALPISRSTS